MRTLSVDPGAPHLAGSPVSPRLPSSPVGGQHVLGHVTALPFNQDRTRSQYLEAGGVCAARISAANDRHGSGWSDEVELVDLVAGLLVPDHTQDEVGEFLIRGPGSQESLEVVLVEREQTGS